MTTSTPKESSLDQFIEACEATLPTYHRFVEEVVKGLETLQASLQEKSAQDKMRWAELNASLEKAKTDLVAASQANATASRAIVTAENTEPKTAASEPETKKKMKRTYSVLVVDDAEINRVLMGHYFKTMPVKVEFSNSGEDAIFKCREKKYDLIIMDLQMKGMSGIEASQKIRDFEKQTPIIALTNDEPNESEKTQALSAGCNDYLGKGGARNLLLNSVSSFLA